MTTFEWCQYAYEHGWADNAKLVIWVEGNKITYAEYYGITQDLNQMGTWVSEGKTTAEEYQTITGQAYAA